MLSAAMRVFGDNESPLSPERAHLVLSVIGSHTARDVGRDWWLDRMSEALYGHQLLFEFVQGMVLRNWDIGRHSTPSRRSTVAELCALLSPEQKPVMADYLKQVDEQCPLRRRTDLARELDACEPRAKSAAL